MDADDRRHLGGALLAIAGVGAVALKPSTIVLTAILVGCVVGAGWAFGIWIALWHGFAAVARAAIARVRSALDHARVSGPMIVRAAYGGADVTERVRSLMRAGRPFTADNATLMDENDPDFGVFKRLEIEYRLNGSTTAVTFPEGTPVDLP